jgi:hypothetical protein
VTLATSLLLIGVISASPASDPLVLAASSPPAQTQAQPRKHATAPKHGASGKQVTAPKQKATSRQHATAPKKATSRKSPAPSKTTTARKQESTRQTVARRAPAGAPSSGSSTGPQRDAHEVPRAAPSAAVESRPLPPPGRG